jgi:DNA-directed RNA polymerase
MLVGIVWKGMNETAAAPKRAMNWVQSVVEQWERDAPQTVLNWTAPTDFPVVCDRFKRKPSHDVKVHFDGEDRYLPSWGKLTSETDWAKVRTAAPPNFIHSLDASHLIFSVNRAVAEGITQLTTVHDAFGTTPARTARLAVILREEFARLYSADQFAPLIAAARAAQVQIAPSPPREDSLKLADIEAAEYLFS